MYQIDNSTAAAVQPAATPAGSAGFFTDGNPAGGTAATIVPAEWLNAVMMELVNVVTAGGLTPTKNVFDQVAKAIKAIGKQRVILNDTGTANAYTATNSPALLVGTWVDSIAQSVRIANANTGASTYSPDGLSAIPIYGLGLLPLQGGELRAGGVATMVRFTIAGVNSGNPICVLIDCFGGAQQVAPATQSNHAVTLGQLSAFQVGRYLGTRQFTASQTYTPTSGTTSVIVELVGGGGAGGNTSITGAGQTSVAGGGGAGGYARSRLTSGFSGVSMTVGAGGLALSTVNGGATSFGALLSATGGTGGSNSPAQTPPVLSIQGHGGAGSSGNLVNSRGGDGMPGIAAQNTSTVSGSGGSSYFGGGGIGQPTGAGPGQTATSPGAGGGGAFAGPSVGATQVGGDGAAGIILVHEFA